MTVRPPESTKVVIRGESRGRETSTSLVVYFPDYPRLWAVVGSAVIGGTSHSRSYRISVGNTVWKCRSSWEIQELRARVVDGITRGG